MKIDKQDLNLGIVWLVIVVLIAILLREKVDNSFETKLRPANAKYWFGVEVLPVDAKVARVYGLPYRRGLLIRRVFDDSPAQKGGLRAGDVIRRVDNIRVTNPAQLKGFTDRMILGQNIRVVIGKEKRLRVLYVRAEQKPQFLIDPNVQNVAYANYNPPVDRPYPYFTFGEEWMENERD